MRWPSSSDLGTAVGLPPCATRGWTSSSRTDRCRGTTANVLAEPAVAVRVAAAAGAGLGAHDIVADTPLGLTLLSAPDRDQGLQVQKSFTLSEHGVTMELTLTNTSAQPQDVAPWQVTRAPREGLIVWGAGDPFDDADRLQKQAEDPGCFYLHSAFADRFEGLATVGESPASPCRRSPARRSSSPTPAAGSPTCTTQGCSCGSSPT